MATKKTAKNSYQKAKDRSWWPLFLFFFFIILLVGGFLIYKYWQKQNYYTSIKSFVFTSYTGPVAPPYQSTKTLTLTADSCTYSVVTSSTTINSNCSLTSADFYKLVNLYYSSNVGTKMTYNNNAQNKTLIGGPTRKMTVNFSDGTSTTTVVSADFLTNAKNFISSVSSYVSQFNNFGF